MKKSNYFFLENFDDDTQYNFINWKDDTYSYVCKCCENCKCINDKCSNCAYDKKNYEFNIIIDNKNIKLVLDNKVKVIINNHNDVYYKIIDELDKIK